MFIRHITIHIILLIICTIPVAAYSVELKTAAQNSSPKYYSDDNKRIKGICIDIMMAIEKIAPEIHFTGQQKFLPFLRLQHSLETDRLNVFFGFKKTTKREKKFNFLDIPLYEIKYVVAVRNEDDINISSLEDIGLLGSQGRILTVKGTATNDFLAGKKYLFVDDGAQTPTIMLKKLISGRGRFAFYHDLGLQDIIRKKNFEKKIRIIPVSFLTYSHYAAFSQKTPASSVKMVEAALQQLQKSGKLDLIYQKYRFSQ